MEKDCRTCLSSLKDNVSPIVNAVRYGHEKCLIALIEAAADVNVNVACDRAMLNLNQFTNMKISTNVWRKQSEAKISKNCKYLCTALHFAASQGSHNIVQLLFEAGADVNSTIRFNGIDNNFRLAPMCDASALILTCGHGHYKCAQSLIQAAADVNIISKDGYNSLIASAIVGSAGITRLLLKENSDINRRTRSGFNALKYSIILDREPKLILLLFAAGESLDISQSDSRTHEKRIPRYLSSMNQRLNLKHMCREAIRKYLINLNPHFHLFNRVPELETPSTLKDFLLYNISL